VVKQKGKVMGKFYWVIISLLLAVVLHAQQTDPLEIPYVPPEDKICFALYTVDENILNLTAQLYPLYKGDDLKVVLEIKENGDWVEIAETRVIYPGYTAPFRVVNWDDTREVEYRVNHMDRAYYTGTIRKNPRHKDIFTVVAFTGNSIYAPHGGDIPRTDIVENVKRLKPDLLFFSGDQVYDHARHYNAWLKFGRDFGDMIKDIPTVCIPDDHDVGHANLWGEGGVRSSSSAGDDGGFYMPVSYVNEVQRAQTSHLPAPYDPTPVKRGIAVYYTDLTWGGISFAILEDRKFKTGPAGVVPQQGPRPDHYATPDYDPEALDVPDAKLLGDRQLTFLNDWATDWTAAKMKVVLSQTIFAGGAHLHGTRDNRLYADLDSNGWPQTGRNKALKAIRKAFGFMIAGDQHLGTITHHGVEDWNDSGYSFCVPSIANLYLRWWAPLNPGKNRKPGMPEYTGEFLDGFNNKLTMWAVANPSPEENHNKLTTRAAGLGVIKLNKQTRKITMECWPRNVDITDPESQQYAGWPVKIDQMDNYGKAAKAWLPGLKLDQKDQVVQVIKEANDEIVYTIRIRGNRFRPKVFEPGTYSVKIGEGLDVETMRGIEAELEK
jgi:phosphodiesterase/alkaline phosphatase D-like protein